MLMSNYYEPSRDSEFFMSSSEFDRTHGYVYIIQSGDNYKIGYSKDPFTRLDKLRTGSAFPLRLIHRISTLRYREIEKHLHFTFDSKRITGTREWFALTTEDIDYIKTLDRNGLSPEDRARVQLERQSLTQPERVVFALTDEAFVLRRSLNNLIGAIRHKRITGLEEDVDDAYNALAEH